VDCRTVNGAKARLIKANFQFKNAKMLVMATSRIATSRERTMPRLTKRRTCSTSAVALDIRLPVCSVSWKAKLRCCSLSYKNVRRS
jgi:hypothetical protein